MAHSLVKPSEWILIVSGALMVGGAVGVYFVQDLTFSFWFWIAVKGLYLIGVLLIVIRLLRGEK